jgi:hypothetical protein
MRPRTLLVLASLTLGAVSAPGQSPGAAPPGFTTYRIVGENVQAPPIALRVRGDRIESPTGPDVLLSVREGRVDGDRVRIVFDVPGGEGRFLGRREADVFRGFIFFDEGGMRGAAPVALVPAGSAVNPEPLPFDAFASGPGVSRIAVVPEGATLRAGERRQFVARVFDESGRERSDAPVEWYGGGASVSATGEFVSSEGGEALVIAVSGDAIGATTVAVEEPTVTSLSVFTDVPGRLASGSRVALDYDALTSVSRWDLDPEVAISSSDPDVVAVEGDALLARAPGRASVTLSAGEARETYEIQVVEAPRGPLSITGVPREPVRTGDVVTLGVNVADAVPTWSVGGPGAAVHAGGDFVAESPGTYTILAALGDRTASAAVRVEPRNLSGRIAILGHGTNLGTHTSDLWPQNGYVYVGTHQANQLRTYDVSDPAHPALTDSATADARVVNDVKVSPDGKLLVATREGAASRRNGILVFSLADPAHPRLVSEYTETLTGGVHNVFWWEDLVFTVNDGTGDTHVIDLSDPEHPKQVGRWGLPVEGRSLHDVWIQDGIAYLSYLRDGLVILDVGGAGKGGTPTDPVLVSRLFYPWGPTHSALRAGDYLFVGDEDFSLEGTVPSIPGMGADPRGPVHVVDVSDLEHPRYVGRYEVPEAGAHNFWVQDDVLYVAYYQGGIRAVDVSGKLRGELYRQGRDIAYFRPSAGPDEAKVPYAPMVWGVFPMFGNGMQPVGDVFYASDYNSGLWSFRLEREAPGAD